MEPRVTHEAILSNTDTTIIHYGKIYCKSCKEYREKQRFKILFQHFHIPRLFFPVVLSVFNFVSRLGERGRHSGF